MVNPKCSYSVGQKKNQSGVAVLLKELLRGLERNNIPHDEESGIRRKLRRRADVKTTATQFFLSTKAAANVTEITRKNSVPRSCIIIPQSDVPPEFFDLLQNEGIIIIPRHACAGGLL